MIVDVGFDLIRRARAGEHQALTRLVETYQGPVYSLALAVMRDRADAADMTQETFVRLLRSLHAYRGDGSNFSSWVHRMTVNICLDALRRRQRSPVASLEQQGESLREPTSVDVWEQPEWRVEWRESATEVRSALAELPRSQRQALTLHYLEDRPYDEIAARMGVPLNTVKSHILPGKEHMLRLSVSLRCTSAALVPGRELSVSLRCTSAALVPGRELSVSLRLAPAT
jgi:RNA polymerase sigma-70 factor (ECF subfamily)